MSGLAVSNLDVRLGLRKASTPVVVGANLEVAPGEVLAILGPSGCGKSTLLRAIAGLVPATGSIAFGDKELAQVPTHRRGFALMFQDGQLFAHLTVADNIAYALKVRGVPRAEQRARVAELLDLIGLSGMGERVPNTLSGGERQRVALARALAVPPRLLMLDEPLSSLDASLRMRMAEDLRTIVTHHASTTATIWVTHDQEEAFAVADRLAVMREGRIVQSGAAAQVWHAPVDAEAALFLGYAATLAGDAARLVAAAAGLGSAQGVALRRSALQVAADGPLGGVVVAARQTTEWIRLSVDVPGAGVVPAVAAIGSPDCGVGSAVRVRVDARRLALL